MTEQDRATGRSHGARDSDLSERDDGGDSDMSDHVRESLGRIRCVHEREIISSCLQHTAHMLTATRRVRIIVAKNAAHATQRRSVDQSYRKYHRRISEALKDTSFIHDKAGGAFEGFSGGNNDVSDVSKNEMETEISMVVITVSDRRVCVGVNVCGCSWRAPVYRTDETCVHKWQVSKVQEGLVECIDREIIMNQVTALLTDTQRPAHVVHVPSG